MNTKIYGVFHQILPRISATPTSSEHILQMLLRTIPTFDFFELFEINFITIPQ